MDSVFVAGSRVISRLNKDITARLDNVMRQGRTVFVGDANGTDKAVQVYLSRHRYPNVFVYCMEECRNNVGHWPIRRHSAGSHVKHDRKYYGIKDAAMARDADYGFMLWDGRSKGTLTNMLNLLKAEKKVLVYIAPKRSFCTLNTFLDLSNALRALGIGDVSAFLESVGATEQSALPLNLTHASR